jgi:putative solute:sodium symporter small subunit
MQTRSNRRAYWRKNLRLTGILMLIWFGVTFCVTFYARELNFDFFGWPFSFWMAAQGSPLVYVVIITFYARYMERLDRTHGFEESEAPDVDPR